MGSNTSQQDSSTDLEIRYLEIEQPQRREEIGQCISQMATDQRHAVIVTAAVWSWFFTHVSDLKQFVLLDFAAFVPVTVVIFFVIRWLSLHRSVKRMALYIRNVESRFGLRSPYGWENFLDQKTRLMKRSHDLFLTTALFWLTIFLVNLALGFVFYARAG